MTLDVTIDERPAHYTPRHKNWSEDNTRRLRWYRFFKALHLTK